jgi:hypothetical protein
MPCAAAVRQSFGHRTRGAPGAVLRALAALLLGLLLATGVGAQTAAGVQLLELSATRGAERIEVDYQLRLALPEPVQDAAQRGVPLYFVATASLWRPRWYWRDDRVARVRREWRLTYQPLTGTWRVSQGGLGQSHATLSDALGTMTRSSGWRLADASQGEVDGRHYVEFEWSLDTTQLPRPLQIGVTGVGGGGEWALAVERTVKLESAPPPAVLPQPDGVGAARP